MKHECFDCHIKTVNKLIKKFKPESAVANEFLTRSEHILNKGAKMANPVLAREIHKLAEELISETDIYENEKITANDTLLKKYDYWKNMVLEDKNPLNMAVRLAVAGNIIDYGAHTATDDVDKDIQAVLHTPLTIDETDQMLERIRKANMVLYLGDNAGEIVFDRLFIEVLDHPNVIYVVKAYPIINDVTIKDARQTSMEEVARVISNGYDAPSTLLDHCSDEFLKHFNMADVIISKGQGNFEGLMHSRRANIFFLLMAKCDPVANLIGVQKGDMVVAGSERLNIMNLNGNDQQKTL